VRPGTTLHLPAAAVVFDNDGVLVDSTAAVDLAWRRWAAAWNLDPDVVLGVAHGHRSRDTVRHFIGASDRVAALAQIDQLELEAAGGVGAVAGSTALVRSMPGDRWAIVTSGTRALAEARLAAAGLPLPAIMITADDVHRGKPDPEGYAAAIHRLGSAPGDVIVMEDSPGGISAARAAGVRCVVGVGASALGTEAVAVVRDLRGLSWAAGLHVEAAGRLR
jgi:mannitol-1-/sugar-/sorbitol-6-phosphatase